MRTLAFSLIGFILLLLGGCGYKLGYRHFAGPIMPLSDPERISEFIVGDDRSITFLKNRLEVSLLPLTADMLNRQLVAYSQKPEGFFSANPYETARNPYTYGDWKPAGEDRAPTRFTVFLLKVKNYAYPKVRVDPARIVILTSNGRRYQVLSLSALTEYYWPYAVAYGGNARQLFADRTDILRKTLFRDEMIFSGQEQEGYIVFPALDRDVEEFTVRIEKMALRFDFRDDPVETVDIPYRFHREVYFSRKPRAEER